MEQCAVCKKQIEEGTPILYWTVDLQKEKNKVIFCSAECMQKWLKRKEIGMWVSIALGVVIAIAIITGTGEEADWVGLLFLFLPYTIRQLAYGLSNFWNKGGFIGEAIAFGAVMLGMCTFVYPVYKFVQELKYYREIKFRRGWVREKSGQAVFPLKRQAVSKENIMGARSVPCNTAQKANDISNGKDGRVDVVSENEKESFSVKKLGVLILALLTVVGVIMLISHQNKKDSYELNMKIYDAYNQQDYKKALTLAKDMPKGYSDYYTHYITYGEELDSWTGTAQELYEWLAESLEDMYTEYIEDAKPNEREDLPLLWDIAIYQNYPVFIEGNWRQAIIPENFDFDDPPENQGEWLEWELDKAKYLMYAGIPTEKGFEELTDEEFRIAAFSHVVFRIDSVALHIVGE